MTKKEKIESARQIAALLVRTLKEVKLTEEAELDALFLALGVSDVEEIEDSKTYCLACDQQERAHDLENIIEEIEWAMKDLFKIKL